MAEEGADELRAERDALQREVEALRTRMADFQRASARDRDAVEGTEALLEREELLQEAERIAHFGTWIWEPATGRITWSEEMFRILGLDPEEARPSTEAFFAAVHPEDVQGLVAKQQDVLRSGVTSRTDVRFVRSDGSIRHTTTTAVVLFDEAGAPRRLVGGILDRTDALATEAKLRHTLALLEEAQRFAKLGSWRFDPDRNELEWSAEFLRITGLPEDVEPKAELFLQLLEPEAREVLRERYRRLLAGAQPAVSRDQEIRLLRPDGQERYVRLESFLAQSPDGRHELRGTLLDITDDVRMRRELAQAHKMEAIGRLAGGIAHDFNNLLQVVGANLELLEHRLGPRRELTDSRKALDSAAGLTRRLLAFGRKAQLHLTELEPNQVVQGTAIMLHRLVGDDVRIELSLAPALPRVSVDPIEIERALVNLVINARDAMPGGGLVRVGTCATELAGKPAVGMWVSDEGPGIAEADLPNIFEPFFTTRESKGGTGLGLATVHGTAEQHGGTVRVESHAGQGSTFTIVLPPASRTADSEDPSRMSEQPAAARGRAHQMLVVDDEPDVAKVTAALLEGCGHGVRVATSPDVALQLWRESGHEVDLLICDVAMGATRGPELVARMAEIGPAPRVLFITGYSDEAIQDSLGHPVLPKPFSLAALRAAVTAALG